MKKLCHVTKLPFFPVFSFDASEQQCGQQPLLPVCQVPRNFSSEVSELQIFSLSFPLIAFSCVFSLVFILDKVSGQ